MSAEANRSTKALVVGYGSIGQRHVRILSELGCRVAVVSSRPIDFPQHYREIEQALTDWKPEYVVVANRTGEHRMVVDALVASRFPGRVLIEKPLFDTSSELPQHGFLSVAVAYNLRRHPLLMKLKALCDDPTRPVTVHVYVGSYLPDWRPNTDYRQGYSAKKDQGGGVLRDLSHELDYISWLFGPWRRLTASGGHLSNLEIDSDDAFTLLMETQRCPLVTVHMNYLDRVPRREIVVNAHQQSIYVDLIANTMSVDGKQESVSVARDDTYRSQHQAMLDGETRQLCSLAEAAETLATIEAAEQAAASHLWVTR